MPLPITAISLASSGQSRGTSGWPSYQETKSAPPKEPSESDAGNVQVRVLDGAGGEDHGVVEGTEIVQGQVAAVGDVAEEPDVAAVQDLVQRVDDPLDPRMVRGDAVADEAVRGRVRLEEVDADLEVAVLDLIGLGQDVRGVDAGRSGADNRNAERTFGRREFRPSWTPGALLSLSGLRQYMQRTIPLF